MSSVAANAVESVYRNEWGRIVATLISLIGDFDLAEECAQEAFTAAVHQWEAEGVPEFPRAWIIQTAKHKAIDRIRRKLASKKSWKPTLRRGWCGKLKFPTTTATKFPTTG